MNGKTVALFLLAASGCTRAPLLAHGPIELSGEPVLVRFEQPMPCVEAVWELCFEFDRPGDSHHANSILVELLTASDQRFALRETELDRRGEALVSLTGKLVALEAPPPSPSTQAPVTFVAAELSSDVPLRLGALRGGGRAK